MPTAPFVPVFVRRRLGIAIRTNQAKVFQAPVVRVSIAMIQDQWYRFPLPVPASAYRANTALQFIEDSLGRPQATRVAANQNSGAARLPIQIALTAVRAKLRIPRGAAAVLAFHQLSDVKAFHGCRMLYGRKGDPQNSARDSVSCPNGIWSTVSRQSESDTWLGKSEGGSPPLTFLALAKKLKEKGHNERER
jgi:hypothetical protein